MSEKLRFIIRFEEHDGVIPLQYRIRIVDFYLYGLNLNEQFFCNLFIQLIVFFSLFIDSVNKLRCFTIVVHPFFGRTKKQFL